MSWFRNRRPSRPDNRFRPSLEALEERWTPANVIATIKRGVLTLTATGGLNHDTIDIDGGLLPGQLEILGSGGTTINGQTTINTTKNVRSIVFNLKGGDDVVNVSVGLAGGIAFNGGSGTNELGINTGTHLGGSVRYVNGTTTANDDTLDISATNIFIGRNVIADFGAGTSTTILGGATIGGRVAVTGGSGADELDTLGIFVGSSLVANLKGGSNLVSIDSQLDGFSGGTANTFIAGALKIITGSGADSINIGGDTAKFVEVAGAVTISSGSETSGGDTVKFDDTSFRSAVLIDLGAGNDQALLDTINVNNTFTRFADVLTILGRAGTDTVTFGVAAASNRAVIFLPAPVLNGGTGIDTANLFNYDINGVSQAVFSHAWF